MKTAILAGSTGLIGSQLLELLLEDDSYHKVIALSRNPLQASHHKLRNLVVDFDKLGEYSTDLRADDVFCCLGTTLRQAGSKEAFRKVDFEYPLSLATITKVQGARRFMLVTALGSNPNSTIFYNRVKGEVEDAIRALGFESLHIFRPSMLLGTRMGHRAGEAVGKTVMQAIGFLIPKKYKAIESANVARAMLAVAGPDPDPDSYRDHPEEQRGVHVHDSDELQDF